MPSNIGERDQAGIPLQREQPILYPWILRNVGLPAQPDINAISAMKQNGEKNKRPFHKNAKRNGLQGLRRLVVLPNPNQCCAVGPKMLGQKRSNGNYTG